MQYKRKASALYLLKKNKPVNCQYMITLQENGYDFIQTHCAQNFLGAVTSTHTTELSLF